LTFLMITQRKRAIGTALIGLAALAAANLVLGRRAERRNPPRGRFITVAGVRLHYLDRGAGPAIVLLHGNGAMSADFTASGIIDLLGRDYRIIAFDRPGFGYSDRPGGRAWSAGDQAALIGRALHMLGVPSAVIVGHSWGNLVALALALRDQSRTAGLVLLSGYFYPAGRWDVALLSYPVVPILGDILCYTALPMLSRALLGGIAHRLFAPAPPATRFRQGFPIGLALRPGQLKATAADSALMLASAAALAPRYRELRIPVTIMAGPHDRIVEFEKHSPRLAAEIPDAVLHEVPEAGHMIHYTFPYRVAGAIRDVARVGFADMRSRTAAETEAASAL
jgi:pimeloyl-ACP methyl ester carboxylesterase